MPEILLPLRDLCKILNLVLTGFIVLLQGLLLLSLERLQLLDLLPYPFNLPVL